MRYVHYLVAALILSCAGVSAGHATTTVSGDISGTTTWTAANSPYYVSGSVTILAGATLTIQAGTIVKFRQGTNLTVNGTLNANGTSGSRVYFTDYRDDTVGGDTNGDGNASSPAAGWWDSIYVNHGSSVSLNYTTLSYAGLGGGSSSIYKSGTSSLSMNNSTVSNTSGSGIIINYSESSTSITNSSITNNSGYGIYAISSSSLTVSGSTVTNNTAGAFRLAAGNLAGLSGNTLAGKIEIDGGTIVADTTLNGAIPYIVNSSFAVDSGVTLTMLAGTILKFAQFTGLTVNGTLNTTGTSVSRVYFTDYRDDTVGGDTNGDGNASNPAAGGWIGITINDSGNASIDYTTLRYAGGSSCCIYKLGAGSLTISNSAVSNSSGYGINIFNSGSNHSITNSIINGNGSDGVILFSDTGTVTISGTSITGNSGYGVYAVSSPSLIISGSAVKDNTAGTFRLAAEDLASLSGNTLTGKIIIDGGTMVANTTLNANIPYVVSSGFAVNSGVTLTAPAGMVMKFDSGQALFIYGTLNATGTSGSRVYFTDDRDDIAGDSNGDGIASSPAAGGWNGIYLNDVGSAYLEYTTLRYADNCLIGQGTGSLSVSNSTVSNCLTNGIYAFFNGSNHSITNSVITGNGSDGIVMGQISGVVTITGNSITGNGGNGINISSTTLTFRNNTVSGNSGYGAYLAGVSLTTPADGNTVTNNTSGSFWLYAENLAPLSPNTYSGKIVIAGGTVSENTTLNAAIIYVVSSGFSVNSGKTLTAPAGTVLKFAIGAGLTVNGTLNTTGTSGSRVYFTDYRDDTVGGDTNGDSNASSPAAGGWDAIYVYAGGSASLDYTTLRWGSNGIYKTGAGSLTVMNSTVINNVMYGIYVYGGAAANILKSSIARNNVGIYSGGGSTTMVGGSAGNGNNIFQNTTFGVQSDCSATINATYNWWGSASGPKQAVTNPAGTGNAVSDCVNYGNFLTAPAFAIAIGILTPEKYSFKHVAVGLTSTPQIFVFSNSGNQPLVIGTVTLTGQHGGDFTITANSCSGQSIAVAGSCNVIVSFSPKAKGLRMAQLDIPSNDVFTYPVLSASLSGHGTTLLPFSDPFSDSYSPYWSIINEYQPSYNLSEAPGNLRIYTTYTDLVGSDTTTYNLFTLPIPSGINKMMVTAKMNFTAIPTENSQQGGIILFTDSNDQPDLANFIRTQYGFLDNALRFQTTTNVAGFGSAYDGTPVSPINPVWVRLIRRGNDYQSLTSTDGVTFTPWRTDTLVQEVDNVGVFALNGLNGLYTYLPVDFDSFCVVPLPTISTPAIVPFGTVSYNSAPAPQQNLTVSNSGFGDLEVSSLTLSGTYADFFTVGQGTCGSIPFIIPAGGSCNLTVSLATSSLGTKTANLTIGSSDIDHRTVNVALSGIVLGIPFNFSVDVEGSGGGWVLYVEKNTICDSDCSVSVTPGEVANFEATADEFSVFTGWSGACSITTNPCTFDITEATIGLRATFNRDTAHKARILDQVIPGNPTAGYYSTLQSAYGGVTLTGNTIQCWAVEFTENLLLNTVPAKSLKIQGGYNGAYSSNGRQTIIRGTLRVSTGRLNVLKLTIKPPP